MTIQITDTENEKFVSGDDNSAEVYDDNLIVSIGGLPDLDFSFERAADLRDVLTAALDLAFPVYTLTVEGLAATE